MNRLLLCFVLASILLPGCVTSKGDLFESVTAPAPQPTEKSGEEDEEEYYDESVDETDDYTPGLEIETFPSGADVYFARSYRGRSTIFIEDPPTGKYLIRITLDGYYPKEEWVHFEEGTYQLLTYHLEEITGFLNIIAEPEEALIRIDGKPAEGMPSELQIGTHTVRVELFGYRTRVETVTIEENTTITLTAILETAPFAVSGLNLSQRVFNPENPGPFGAVQIQFDVDNRGYAEIDILDPVGTVVRTLKTNPFIQRRQSALWDGRDDSGSIVPDGDYTILLRATGEDGIRVELTAATAVDHSLIIQPRVFFSGLPGLLYCPTPDVLSKDSLQITSAAVGRFQDGRSLVPVQAGIRFTLPGGLGCTLQGTLLAVSDQEDGYSLGLGMKYPLADPVESLFSLALGGKLTFQGVRYTDTLTNFSGLSLSLPAGLYLGPLRFYVTPEVVVSYNYIDYDALVIQSPGLYSWAYGRAGFSLEVPGFSLGFSAALRTAPFSRGFAIHWPMEIGGEATFIIPGTRFFGSILGMGEIEFAGTHLEGYYILIGAGLHFLY